MSQIVSPVARLTAVIEGLKASCKPTNIRVTVTVHASFSGTNDIPEFNLAAVPSVTASDPRRAAGEPGATKRRVEPGGRRIVTGNVSSRVRVAVCDDSHILLTRLSYRIRLNALSGVASGDELMPSD